MRSGREQLEQSLLSAAFNGPNIMAEIEAAAKDGDSLGGVVEVLAYGLPVGLGSYVHWDRKIDGLLSQAIMSIQAVKGVEIGDGFDVAGRRGSAAHDPISWDESSKSYRRESTLAGGTEGGMTTGELLVVRGNDDRYADLMKRAQQFAEIRGVRRIKIRRRFIRQQDLRLMRQGSGESHTLLFASG